MRAQKIALLMGGTLGKTEINVFSTLSLFSLAQERGPMLALWGTKAARALGQGPKNAPRGFHQVLQKLWGSPGERFQQSFALSSTRVTRTVCKVHRAQVGPIAPSGPDRPRLRQRAPGPTQSGSVNCTKLALPGFARYSCKAPIAPSGPSGPDQGPIVLSLLALLYKVTRQQRW